MIFEQTKQNNILTFKTNKYTLKHLKSIERDKERFKCRIPIYSQAS